MWALVAVGLAVSATQAVFLSSTAVYWLTLITLSAISGFTLLRCLFTPNHITAWEFFAALLGSLYGLGTLNTEWNVIDGPRDLIQLTGAPLTYVHMAMGNILLLVSLLLAIGRISRFYPFAALARLQYSKREFFIFACLTASACIALIATGAIGYHGDFLSEGSVKPSTAALFAVRCSGPAAAALIFIWPAMNKRERLVSICIIAILFAVSLYVGRRPVIFNGIICVMAYFVRLGSQRIINKHSLTAVAMALVIMPVITQGFMAMRLASYQTPLGEKPSVQLILEKGWDIIWNDSGEVKKQSDDNLGSRTYLIGYLSEITWRTDIRPPLYGELLAFNVGMAVPRVLWPTKFKYLKYGAEEMIANTELGLVLDDNANTIMTTGMTDFGLAGMIFYPIFVLLLLMLLTRGFMRAQPAVALLTTFAVFITLASVEAQMAAYFGAVRDLLILGGAVQILLLTVRALQGYNAPAGLTSVN